jgi:ankyrin repeat protein
MIASLQEIKGRHRLDWSWFGAVNMIVSSVGMDRLLAHRWPDNSSLVSILVRLMPNSWLDQALAQDAGRKSLREANVHGWTPLHHATAASSTKAVRKILLLDDEMGTLRLHQTKLKRIALHNACMTNNAKVVDLLLERNGKEQRLSCCKIHCMPIHLAAGIGADGCILQRLLAEHAAEQTLARTLVLNRNALMCAVAAKAPSLVRQLLAVETTLADQLEAIDSRGQAAADYAREVGDADIIRQIASASRSLSLASSSAATSMAPGRTAQPRDNERPASMTLSLTSPEAEVNPYSPEGEADREAQ